MCIYNVYILTSGTETLPGPVREFHANYITDSGIGLSWESPSDSNVTHYEVYYQIADPTLGRDLTLQSNSVNTKMILISGFYVVTKYSFLN